MKKLIILFVSASFLFLTGCGAYSGGFKQNTGMGTKNFSTIATVKGGGAYCKH